MSCPECGSTAWQVTEDNGVVKPTEGDRVEWCSCECGHTWRQVLKA